MATLQQQGVPIRSSLRGPQYTGKHRRTNGQGQQKSSTAAPRSKGTTRANRANPNTADITKYSPTRAGEKAAGSIGLLEAEFLGSLILLIMLMFANSSATYANKIMSIMKRGTLICFYFFILALLAAIGPNMEKVAKALGALCLVTILLTSPIAQFNSNGALTGGALYDVDQLIKNDWIGTGEHGSDVGSADTGSSSGSDSTSGGGSALGAAAGAIERVSGILGSLGFGIIK
jgi:hypothetical protein